jgi:DeoR/GlpR family transcriptional regulator of sugar metabolism
VLATERRQHLVERVKNIFYVRIAALQVEIGVSRMTISRNLPELEPWRFLHGVLGKHQRVRKDYHHQEPLYRWTTLSF